MMLGKSSGHSVFRREDPWLFFKAKSVPRARKFGKRYTVGMNRVTRIVVHSFSSCCYLEQRNMHVAT